MNILIAGANGHTGRLLIKELADHPTYNAIAMIRDENQAEALKELGVTDYVVADLEHDLTEAVKDCDVVLFVAGSGSKTGPDKTISVDQEGAKRLVDAAQANHSKQFIMLSSIGADTPTEPLKQYLEAKGEADRYLKESGLTYTIVRPGRLTFDAGTGLVDITHKLEHIEGRSIPREDLARVMTAVIQNPAAYNQTFELLSGDVPIDQALSELSSS